MAKNPRLIDMTGLAFGEWRVVDKAGNHKGGGALWNCECSCGTKRVVVGRDLRAGKSISCGCVAAKLTSVLMRTHGGSKTRLYRIWKAMQTRCTNPNVPGYANYGGRGITVSDEWRDFAVFRSWALANGYRDDLSIERRDVNGGYSAENCEWATAAAQSANRRFTAKAPDGELWLHKARKNGIKDQTYRDRMAVMKWTPEKAATTPVQIKRRRTP